MKNESYLLFYLVSVCILFVMVKMFQFCNNVCARECISKASENGC